jgi:hypothetical protein
VGQVRTGGTLSLVKLTVWEAVPVFPQASVTVQFFVTDTWQPVTTSAAMVPVAVRLVEQLSVTVAPPKAAATCAGVALQPGALAGLIVITGLTVSVTLNV